LNETDAIKAIEQSQAEGISFVTYVVIKLNISAKKSVYFLVITCPSLWGENIVMRIIDSSAAAASVVAK